jgi:hypothetical protein
MNFCMHACHLSLELRLSMKDVQYTFHGLGKVFIQHKISYRTRRDYGCDAILL